VSVCWLLKVRTATMTTIRRAVPLLETKRNAREHGGKRKAVLPAATFHHRSRHSSTEAPKRDCGPCWRHLRVGSVAFATISPGVGCTTGARLRPESEAGCSRVSYCAGVQSLRVSFEGECAKWREESYDSEQEEPGASSQNRHRPTSIDKPHAILCNTDPRGSAPSNSVCVGEAYISDGQVAQAIGCVWRLRLDSRICVDARRDWPLPSAQEPAWGKRPVHAASRITSAGSQQPAQSEAMSQSNKENAKVEIRYGVFDRWMTCHARPDGRSPVVRCFMSLDRCHPYRSSAG
jgi:hypothetical protein